MPGAVVRAYGSEVASLDSNLAIIVGFEASPRAGEALVFGGLCAPKGIQP